MKKQTVEEQRLKEENAELRGKLDKIQGISRKPKFRTTLTLKPKNDKPPRT